MKRAIFIIAIVLLGAFVGAYLALKYYDSTLNTTKNELEKVITNGFSSLQDPAQKLYRSLPTTNTDKLITDCPAPLRQRFDNKLDRLAKLQPEEFDETWLLFAACADYFAKREALGVEELKTILKQQEENIQLYGLVANNFDFLSLNMKWQEFADIKARQAELLDQQVRVQQEILEHLMAGEAIDSPVIKEALKTATAITTEASLLARNLEEIYQQLLQYKP